MERRMANVRSRYTQHGDMGHRLRTEATIEMAECSSCEHRDIVLAAFRSNSDKVHGFTASQRHDTLCTTLALPCFF